MRNSSARFPSGSCFRNSRYAALVQPKPMTLIWYLRLAAKKLGILLGWHSFRHSCSTQLLKKYPVKVVSEILGHGDIETTLSIYQHPVVEDRRAPLEEMAIQMLPDVTKSVSATVNCG